MPHYYFDCRPESIDQMGNLCTNKKMKEFVCNPPSRQWIHEGRYPVWMVRYDILSDPPLLVQTRPGKTYAIREVNRFLRAVLEITNTNTFYQDYGRTMPLEAARMR
jgi:hypothetical protein